MRDVVRRLCEVALALVIVAASGAMTRAVTVDGILGAGEWDGSEVVISDPNEVLIPDSYDVEFIRLKGGATDLYLSVDVWNDTPSFVPTPIPTGRAFLNFDWDDAAGAPQYYGLTYNDHKGFPLAEMHLVQYTDGTRTTFADLGQMTFAISSAIEVAIPWTLLPGTNPATYYAEFDRYAFLYNNGGNPPDDREDNSTVNVVPEPLTLTGLAMAFAVTLPRLVRGLKRKRCRAA